MKNKEKNGVLIRK